MRKLAIIIVILVIVILCVFLLVCNMKENIYKEKKSETISQSSLMEYGDFKDITLENINSIEIIKYTEAGVLTDIIEDYDEIIRVYNMLKTKKIGKETNRAAEDNTTIYKFNLKDNLSISIEIECDWIVLNNKRYILE